MVITDVNQVVYQGDGATTAYPFTFRIIDATDIKLLLIDADGTETDITSDYFVDINTNTVYYPGYAPGAEPGLADQPAPVQDGQRLVVYRELPVTQEKDLGEKWPFFVIELALDKLTMILQQIKGWWDRCLKISPAARATHPNFDMTFPVEAGKSFRVNAEGTGFEVSDDPGIAAEAAYEALAQAEDAKTAAEQAQSAAESAAAVTELQAVWFDTAADMAEADLTVGITAGTKGYYAINDGSGGTYAVREAKEGETNNGYDIILLNNGNVAERIKSKKEIINGMIDNIDLFVNPFMCMRKFGSYIATQGCCVAKGFLIVTVYEAGQTDGRLYVIDIKNKTVVSYIDGVHGHLNSICYDADNEYVCVADEYDIIRYSLNDEGALTYVDTITSQIWMCSLAWNNGVYYINRIHTVVSTTDLSTSKTIIDVDALLGDDFSAYTHQGMEVDDNFIYLCYSGSDNVERIHIHDKENGNLLKVLTFERGVFGELEEVAVYNGYLFININRPYNDSMLGVYRIPLQKSALEKLNNVPYNPIYDQENKTTDFYVDTSVQTAFPTGQSDNPYNSIGCAYVIANQCKGNVRVHTEGSDMVGIIKNSQMVYTTRITKSGTLRIAAPDNNQGFSAIVSFNSMSGSRLNAIYVIQGYGAGGSQRTMAQALSTFGSSITYSAVGDANAFEFELANLASADYSYVTITVLGNIASYATWNEKFLEITFTPSN